VSSHMPDDADLVAYLDGELSPDERARVEAAVATDPAVAGRVLALSETTIGLRQAFDPLLSAAPTARMLAALGEPTAEPRPTASDVARKSGSPARRRWLVAASVALFVLGGLADHLVLSPRAPSMATETGHWRDIVANYVRLYTSETFANAPDDPALQARELATVGNAIGLRLEPAATELADIPMKQAQLLRYDQKSLAEINYVDPRYGPMSLCIIASSEPAAAPKSEVRRGLNVSYWNDGQHGFMVIGALPAAELAAIADTLTGRFKTLKQKAA
jgi:anti-sigma factor RsiW